MPTRSIDAASSAAVSTEYSGKWVAWNSDHSRIIAHSDSITDLWQVIRNQAIDAPVFEKIPRSDMRFVGTR